MIVGQAAAQGFTGQFIGLGPTWNPALLDTPAAPALEALYLQSGYWGPFGTDTPGHQAMREALGDVEQPNDGYTAGWAWSYPLKAALEEWLDGDYDKDRAGLLEAVAVAGDGRLRGHAARGGRQLGPASPTTTSSGQSVISKVDTAAPTGVTHRPGLLRRPDRRGVRVHGACFEG